MLTFCFYCRMAESRFNNPYFWPPPPAVPGQVSDSTDCIHDVIYMYQFPHKTVIKRTDS